MRGESRAETGWRAGTLSRGAAATAIAVGLAVLLGWGLGAAPLTSVFPGLPTMKANTAVCFILSGVALWLLSIASPARGTRTGIGLACAAAVALIGLLTLAEYLFDWELSIDQLLVREGPPSDGAASHPGRMSANTALSLLLVGSALLTVNTETRRGLRPAEWLALTAALISYLALLGYLYGVESLRRIGPYSSMALHTVLTMLMLSAGILFARPTRGLIGLVTSSGAGGVMGRRLLPAALLIPPLLGWLRILGEGVGWYDTSFGRALLVSSVVVVFTALIWRNVVRLNRVDAERLRADQARIASLESEQAIIETALDGVVVMDDGGRIADFNSAAELIFGQRRGEVIGRPMHEVIIPPALQEAHRRGLARYLETGEHRVLGRRIEISGLRADGREIPLELSINRMPGAGPARFAGFVRDITERKRTADALRESQERYRTLAESLPHLVWTCRPDGWCDYLSRQWVEYTGRAEQEQLGYGWAEHLHPDDRERTQQAWAQATARGDQFDIEFRIRRADGVYRWFKTRALPLRDGAGRIVKWFGSNTDFDDYKHADERSRAQLARLNLLDQTTRAISERQDLRSIFQVALRSLEERMPIDFGCVCLHDVAGDSLTVTCVGLKSQPLALELAMPEEARIAIDQNGLAQCVRGRLVYEPDISQMPFPFLERLARGGLHALVVAPLLVESHVFGVLVAARRDVRSFSSADCEFLRQLSEHIALAAHQARLYAALQDAYDDLRQTQQAVMQQERLRALGQMASGIAHDINNALSPVALYTDSLLESEPNLSERTREYLKTIQHAADDIAATVARMREFYREREPQLALSRVTLSHLVQQVVQLTRARWSDIPQQRGVVIDLVTELPIDLPEILAVESEIREALTNLIFNAVDAMPEGGRLTLRTSVSAAGSVRLEVIDTGVGMDDDTRRRCLEPFFTTKGERGTGLGLAMVYGTVQRHAADLEIESVLGQGTTMRIVFAAAGEAGVEPPQPEPARVIASRLRILVVDDDPLLLKSLRETLETDGHTIVTANGGQEGIDAFRAAAERKEPFSVVITDLGMPYVDGRRLAGAVKGAAPSIPVILLTGWGQRIVAEGEVPPHVDQVLSKPPKLRELRTALAALCQPRQGD